MEIYTIGFTQTTAERFFKRLADVGIGRLLDVRLNNTSQLAGFAKAKDLPYFLSELVGAVYEHEPLLAPTQELLDEYKKRGGDWLTYEARFLELMRQRQIEHALSVDDFQTPTALLCSEPTVQSVTLRLRRNVEAFLMLGLARAYRAPQDDRERHWLQLNGLCLIDRPCGSTP